MSKFSTLAVTVIVALVTLPGDSLAEWAKLVEPRFGGHIAYPADVFAPYPADPGEAEARFVSSDGRARLAMSAWTNDEGEAPGRMKSRLLAEARDRSVTYNPGGRNWFVLSGYKGDDIYYQKVMYSCGGQVVTAFGLSYPAAQRHVYDPIVERIEDSFRPGRHCPEPRR